MRAQLADGLRKRFAEVRLFDEDVAHLKSGDLSNQEYGYGRSLSISALSAASIVRYDASTAITRDPASAIQPV